VPAGTTLLELLAALGIIRVLAGVAVLEHQAVRARLAVHMAAQQVAMDVRGCRTRAVAENTAHRLAFASGADTYTVQRRSSGRFVDSGPRRLPHGVRVVGCSARDNAMTFTPRGTASSFGTLIVGNDRGDRRTVVVDIAGRVRVQ
jgi:Tfp pilus assembly protein FimT